MRVASILLAAGLAAFVNAQSTTSGGNAPSTTQDAAQAAASSAQAQVLRCLEACKAGDVDCQSHCITVPSPNDAQVNATNNCVAACPQGKGSEADTEAYRQCVGRCIGENYYTSSAGTPRPTGSTGGGSSSGNGNSGSDNNNNNNSNNNDNGGDNNSDSSSPSGTSGNGASRTSTGSAAATSSGAAAMIGASSGVIGAVGFMAAVLAL
ncbi:hypothetical protein L209DRAFT_757555 [Thermothelomyces heterothallicus CBS 203.75]